MTDIVRIDQNARRSRASVFGDLVFLAGQVADDKGGDITQQTREVLAKIDDLLARADTDKSRLLSVQIWLKSMDDFDAMNRLRRLGGAGTDAMPCLRHRGSRRSPLPHRDHCDWSTLGMRRHFRLVPFLRLAYAASQQNLREAVMRIANACKELS